jgi:tetratricopeptide (TPR) repeat protein
LLGELYLATGAVEQARATLEEVVRFHPTSPRGYALLAQFHVKQGDWEAARATLEKGIDATDRNGYLVLQNAMLLDELGERDASMLAYESLLARYPDALIAVNNLAALLVRGSSDPAKLDRALELAVRLRESEIPEFLDTLGWVHFQRGEYVEALPYLEQAVAGKPGHPEMRYHLGLIYAKLGRTEDAKKHLWLAATAEDFSAQSDARREFDALNSGSE